MEGGIQLSKVAKYSVCAFVFYVFWFKYVYRQINMVLYVTVAVASVSMLFDIWYFRKDLLDFCPVGVLINLVLAVYSIATGLWVAWVQDVLIGLVKTYASFSLVCIVICYVSSVEGSIDWMVNLLISVNLVSSVSILLNGYPIEGYGYVLGPAQNPNYLGVIMDIGIFCLAYKCRKETRRLWLYLIFAGIFAYTVVNSGSRKSLLAIGIICALWFWPMFVRMWKTSSNEKRTLITLLSLLLIGAVIYYFATEFINTDIYKRMQMLGDDDEFSSRNRKLYYQYALDYWAVSPVFGIGLGQFQYWNPYHQMSHSTYAEAISSWGLVGCLIYFIPAIGAGVQAVRLSFTSSEPYVPRIVLAVLVMEAFLGVGQVWFYEFEHLITWTLVFYILSELLQEEQAVPRRVCKYVKA